MALTWNAWLNYLTDAGFTLDGGATAASSCRLTWSTRQHGHCRQTFRSRRALIAFLRECAQADLVTDDVLFGGALHALQTGSRAIFDVAVGLRGTRPCTGARRDARAAHHRHVKRAQTVYRRLTVERLERAAKLRRELDQGLSLNLLYDRTERIIPALAARCLSYGPGYRVPWHELIHR
ncbi:hypothetical protein [Luteibacter sp. 9133]|uniref:hypothetical protein n=1 Tax=Luteibacter sp. 9133 TaxID=1500891 RepID=UPI0005BAFF0F|nr:hypothetical protein [Luteibacter sp. 9133]